MAAASAAQTWATATAKNSDSGRVIVYRYLKELPSGFDKAAQPERFIISWKYEGERGMPAPAERQRMNAMEDAMEAMDVGGHPKIVPSPWDSPQMRASYDADHDPPAPHLRFR